VSGAPRTLVLGDMQAPLERILAVLRHRGALRSDRPGEDRLREGFHLVSIGDHVDYGHDPEAAGREGEAVLDWLADQPASRVTLLLGNHDAARVVELAGWTDARFGAARAAAAAVRGLPEGPARAVADAAFRRSFPDAPTLDLVARDYASYTEAQAARIAGLLRGGRMRLATTVPDADGRPLLVTHAGVTTREVRLLVEEGRLDAAATDAAALAAALEAFLDAALARWATGTPLDLAPLYLGASHQREAGGLLYHRPANPDPALRPDADLAWEFDPERPRRFAPGQLPAGLSQVCGHTPHRRAWRELVGFSEGEVGEPGAVRTLVAGPRNRYVARRLPPAAAGEAHLYCIDASLADTPPERVEGFGA